MAPKIIINNIDLFKTEANELGDFYDISRILGYASRIKNELIIDVASGSGDYLEESRKELSITTPIIFDEPKQMLTIKKQYIVFLNIMFKFPNNLKFENCYISFYNSYLTEMPTNTVFSSCKFMSNNEYNIDLGDYNNSLGYTLSFLVKNKTYYFNT